jgi:hypothetical protein
MFRNSLGYKNYFTVIFKEPLTVRPIPTRKKRETVKMDSKILDPNSVESDVETISR